MLQPERRTRRDVLAATVIVVVLLVVTLILWLTSDVRATVSEPAAAPLAPPAAAQHVPETLTEAWRARSQATDAPVIVGSVVVTGDGGTVLGRAPDTGQPVWTYRRDLPLCTVAAGFGRSVAVYRRGAFCSEVTSLNADGSRGPQRNSAVSAPTRLIDEGTHMIATGERYAEAWRADMVMTVQYGDVPARVNPGTQPRHGCQYPSFAAGGGRLAVIERCPGEGAPRLTVQPASPKESETPEPDFSTLLTSPHAQVVARSLNRTAVLLPDPARLAIYDDNGTRIAEHPLSAPADVAVPPPGRAFDLKRTPQALLWRTGSGVVALDPGELYPLWTVPGALGVGGIMAGQLLLPVRGGLAVLEPRSGERSGFVPVDRAGYVGPVSATTTGPTVLEQRGDALVALRG